MVAEAGGAAVAAEVDAGADDDDDDEGEWREALDVTGKKYFWNTRTRESRWEKPAETKPAK